MALLNLTELQCCKPKLKEWRLWLFVPYIYIATQQRPHYSQPSGNYHSQGWNHSSVLWTCDCTFIHTYIQVQSCKSTRKEFLCTWPSGGICSRVCHYIRQTHSEPLIGCSASLLQSTITTVAQFKQLRLIIEHKYTVNITRITHEQILTSLPLRVQRSPLCC